MKFKFEVVTLGPKILSVTHGNLIGTIALTEAGATWEIHRKDALDLYFADTMVYKLVGCTAVGGKEDSTFGALRTVVDVIAGDGCDEWAVESAIVDGILLGSFRYGCAVTYDSDTQLTHLEQDLELEKRIDNVLEKRKSGKEDVGSIEDLFRIGKGKVTSTN